MVKDYANRKSSFRNKPKSKRYRKIIIFLLVFGGAAFLINRLVHHFTGAKNPVIKTVPSNSIKAASQPVIAARPNVQFDFYTILSKERVSPILSSQSLNAKPKYYLEITKVAKEQDAVHLKNELGLLGFDAFITSKKNGVSIVSIGPYYSVNIAKIDQNKLHSKNINSILKKK
jgi:cell division protein FtsN